MQSAACSPASLSPCTQPHVRNKDWREGEDVHLLDEAREALRCSSYGPLAKLQCDVIGGDLVIHGRLPSYYLKQVAQTVVMALETKRTIRNEVTVK